MNDQFVQSLLSVIPGLRAAEDQLLAMAAQGDFPSKDDLLGQVNDGLTTPNELLNAAQVSALFIQLEFPHTKSPAYIKYHNGLLQALQEM